VSAPRCRASGSAASASLGSVGICPVKNTHPSTSVAWQNGPTGVGAFLTIWNMGAVILFLSRNSGAVFPARNEKGSTGRYALNRWILIDVAEFQPATSSSWINYCSVWFRFIQGSFFPFYSVTYMFLKIFNRIFVCGLSSDGCNALHGCPTGNGAIICPRSVPKVPCRIAIKELRNGWRLPDRLKTGFRPIQSLPGCWWGDGTGRIRIKDTPPMSFDTTEHNRRRYCFDGVRSVWLTGSRLTFLRTWTCGRK